MANITSQATTDGLGRDTTQRALLAPPEKAGNILGADSMETVSEEHLGHTGWILFTLLRARPWEAAFQ